MSKTGLRVIEPAFDPPPPLPPAVRKGPGGRREVLEDGEWVPREEPPTPRQIAVWNLVQGTGSQSAAAKALGVHQGAIQDALKGYMRRMGIEGPMPGYQIGAKAKAQRAERKATKPTPHEPAEAGDALAQPAAVTEPEATPAPVAAPHEPGEAVAAVDPHSSPLPATHGGEVSLHGSSSPPPPDEAAPYPPSPGDLRASQGSPRGDSEPLHALRVARLEMALEAIVQVCDDGSVTVYASRIVKSIATTALR